MSDVIIHDKELSSSAFSHVINAPIETVDIAGWLFNLPEAEYQRCCPPDHISCGATSTDDGKGMAINVEMIGQTLMIQHYVAEVATSRVQLIWTLSVKRVDDQGCKYTNSVVANPTAEFMKFIAEHKMSFEEAAANWQRDGGDHNRRETPLFAASIERKARRRRKKQIMNP